MDDLQEKMVLGEPLMQQAIEALRRYHQARDTLAPIEEVERLRVVAESLFQAISQYQLRALGGHSATCH
ncbi:hypothetical protein [Pseudomonas sp. CES]|uniref:hypothetical protein n=1 Tax=Pseudomonas sp. CES TaxID=2719586 RepID=UPI00146FD183|nr:hypothetical protein [Pseudomonas sp. CES]KAF4558731.1 hypothetical protein HBJ16_003722 [Pseudomonas sp. CES]